MRNNKLTLLVLFVLGLYANIASAQQDAQYTQYMYNTLSVNPAYAGARDVFSFVGLYRNQWFGNNIKGTPKTFTASVHSPIAKNVSLGLNAVRDEIFITQETYLDLDFSYTLHVSDEARLNLGIKGGAHLLDVDTQRAYEGAYNPGDPDAEVFIDNKFSPQFGVGAYYFTNNFYLGLSAPNILETEHFDESSVDPNSTSSATAKEKINFYLTSGYVFDLNEDIKFKPAVLTKLVEGAPLQVDLSANFLVNEKFTLGAAYRWSAALSAMVGFQISEELMLGLAYDRETTELTQYNNGSFEVFLRYEIFKNSKNMVSPRFF
ncbi:PorP/SprF family type IX secretion system membrane protein [Ulvibacter litoralis]|uniref:Type IX secretion system membrane protein, PorP/SprF family n=1 Tax=Ulvibacter litoralis TaxID=227084 RepID=A0A1G7GAD8_9FLAO|nr:type IX secretion system membrane protein PorP/SprF [Ulvibacter litoralis]GHC57091.1 membrane protein [Ulvibacter litoralis]SDE84989.1 type IX secretion system membrane protein, PorP/SprF family [Ulvibacter litoralis]